MTLIEFLNARLAEDEAIADEAINQRITEVEAGRYNPGMEPEEDFGISTWDDWTGGPGIRMGAERLRAEVAAKRALAEFAAAEDAAGSGLTDAQGLGRSLRGIAVLRHLASVYADHEDFRDEWR